MAFLATTKSATFFIITSAIIFVFLASTANPPHPPFLPSSPPPPPPVQGISKNATRFLRSQGYSLVGSILYGYPKDFFSSGNTTVFAVKNFAFSLATATSPAASSSAAARRLLLKNILLYHTVPISLPIADLMKLPPGSCLPNLLHGDDNCLEVRRMDSVTVQVNGVKITHPNLVLGLTERIAIHGVGKVLDGSGLIPPDAAAVANSVMLDRKKQRKEKNKKRLRKERKKRSFHVISSGRKREWRLKGKPRKMRQRSK